MSFYHPTKTFDLTGKVLVVPIVSVANVSQLAVDLLVASLSLERIGLFDTKYLIPAVGAREDGQAGITTSLELYGKNGMDIIVAQQRSPPLKSYKQDFVDALLGFVQESGVAAALFLGGVDMSNRTDAQMLAPTYYIRPANSPALDQGPFSILQQLPIPAYNHALTQPTQANPNQSSVPFIPGGGLGRRLLSSIPASWSIPTICLLHYVMEGDNRDDAHLLAAVVAKVLGADRYISSWKQPSSWKKGLFGASHDQTLYG